MIARLYGHLQNTFTEKLHLKFHVITKGDRVNGLPKSFQFAISGFTLGVSMWQHEKMYREDDLVNQP